MLHDSGSSNQCSNLEGWDGVGGSRGRAHMYAYVWFMLMYGKNQHAIVKQLSSNLKKFSSVQSLSHVQFFVTPWAAAHQASLSISNSWILLKHMSIESVMSSNHLILCHPLLLPPSILPSIKVFQMSQFFTSGGQSIGVLASASVLPVNIQDWFPDRLVGSPCCPRDSQESSLTPQFKSISSSVLSLLYGPTLTFIHDYWKNHSFD